MPKKKLITNEKNDKTIDEAFRDYIKYCRVKNLSEATVTYYEDCFYYFKKYYTSDSIHGIDSQVIDGYILYLKQNTDNNDTSIQTRLRGLRTILYYFMELGYLERFKMRLPKATQKPKDVYSDHELKLLLNKPNVKDTDFGEFRTWSIINFLVGTGCRANTVVNVKIQDIDFDSGFISFTTTKNMRIQRIPLSKELNVVLREYLRFRGGEGNDYLFPNIYGDKMTVNALGLSVKRYNHRRGVMRTSLHAFRHTFAKYYIVNGGDVFRLQKILGHSSLEMVRNYVNLFGEDLQNGYDKLNPLSKLSTNKTRIKLNK